VRPRVGVLVLVATAGVAAAASLPNPPARAAVSVPAQERGQDTTRAALRRLMAQKVARAELILRGLAQGDLKAVQRAADELVQIAAQANWSVDPREGRFAVHEAEFQRRAAQLAKFARDSDVHASYYQFLQVMLSCFDCHEESRPPHRR